MQRKLVIACPLAFGEVGVKERIQTVLNYKKPTFWTILVAVAACAAVAVCFLTNPRGPGDPIQPTPEGIDYSGYDALIAQARDVLEHFDGSYPGEEPFSSVFYQHWDYETLGYLIKDIDGNGVDELIFGANTDGWDNGGWDGIIYNIYTIANGEVVRVLDGWERNRYYLCEDGYIANEASSSAFESRYSYYTYSGTELTMVESVLYYGWIDEAHPWFYSTDKEPDAKTAEPISEEKAAEIRNGHVHQHPQYTPFAA
ncbi:hypothetical protein SDC9_63445 [bioreactor metagenome]|uniref:Uncharacterized protein n=1 Tax=bioreactor metagenome TaxID=1076179 RepID=A0A644XMM7_9ZZZZ